MSSMKQIDHPSAVDGPVVSEGGRGPSALSTGQAPTTPAMVPGATVPPATALPKVAPLAPGQRWSSAGASRASARSSCACCAARARSSSPASSAFPSSSSRNGARRPTPPSTARSGVRGTAPDRGGGRRHRTRRRHAAHRRTQHGERAAPLQDGAHRPFGPAEVALMAKATSPVSGQPYGIRRVCQVWGVPRYSFYAAPRHRHPTPPPRRPRRRAVDRNPPSRTRPCSPPSGAISIAPPGPARATARSGPACACATASASPPNASCA